MIKFAVTRPAQRIQSINHGLSMLKWHEDPYLKHFDTQIEQNMTVVSTLFTVASDSFLLTQDTDQSSSLATP